MNERTPIRTAVVTVSDTRALETDKSGELLVILLGESGAIVVERSIVTDETESIRSKLAELVQSGGIDLVLTTGGTGFAPRDNTPEATRSVIQREAPGIAEALRRETASKTPMAMISRAVAGIAGATLIINLPGSPKGVEECFEVIRPVLQHAVDLIRGETSHVGG
jgi:molybdenum cofactor synthesis domain-containing protein